MKKLKITEMNRLDKEEFKVANKIPLLIILDNIRSLHNVGAIFRTSDAFRIEKIILCGITATPPQTEIHKTALGAEDTVDWIYYKDTLEAVLEVKKMGYKVCAIEQVKGSIMLNEFLAQKQEKLAIIMGNEVKGVQQTVIDQCDVCLEIPQYGTKHSLNVSVTTGIVIWDLFNKISLLH